MTESDIDVIKQICFTKANTINGRCSDKRWWNNRNLLELYEKILTYTNFLSQDTSFNVRIFHVLNKTQHIPKCLLEGCENNVSWHSSINRYSTYCSKKCTSIANKKVGKNNPFAKESIKKKIKDTNLQKYGVDNYSKTSDFSETMKEYHRTLPYEIKKMVQDKREKTNIERYGVSTTLLNESVISKIKDSMIECYGVESPLQNKEILTKARNTTKERYDRDSFNQRHLNPEFILNIKDLEWVTSQLEKISIRQLAQQNNVSYSHMCKLVKKIGYDLTQHSYFENEVCNYLNSLGIKNIERNDRSVLQGKEIDILLPDYNLGIECDGVYWHGEVNGRKSRNFHLDKTVNACSKNIRLVHIFENEWLFKSEAVKGVLQTILNSNERIYGRKCLVKKISSAMANDFLNNFHLQGACKSSISYGLFHNEELVSVMTFGKSRYNKNISYELLRYSTKQGITVVGGPSKLFNAFINEYSPDSIISYCDLRWFTGDIYNKLGFEYSHTSSPNYFYIEPNGELSSRIKYQKHKLQTILETFDPSISEWENMKNNGYDRIWDCGNSVWIWSNKH